jgi:PAS domain S-box-containing protein
MVEARGRACEAETARQEAEERYRLIVETTTEGIWLLDADGRTTFTNEALASMLGYAVAEVVGRPLFDFVGEDGVADAKLRLARRREGRSDRTPVEFRHADGSRVATLVSGRPMLAADGSYAGALAIITDIRELRSSQEVLGRRVRQLEAIAELGRAIVGGIALDELLRRIPPAVAGALGAGVVTVLERLPDDRLRVVAGHGWDDGVLGRVLAAGEGQAGYQLAVGEAQLIVDDLETEGRFVVPAPLLESGMRSGLGSRIDGIEGPYGVIAAHMCERRSFSDDDANFVESVATLIASVVRRDHAAELRRTTEAALRSTAERFQMLAENAQDAIFRFRLRPEPAFEYMSPAIERITGHPPDRFYEDPGFSLFHMHPEDTGTALVNSSLEDVSPVPVTGRWLREDGRVVWFERTISYVRDEDGLVVALEGIIRDVTERVADVERQRSLEEQLHQTQKMEAVGQLAGGIAHDFNNLLLAVQGYAELAVSRLEDGDAHAHAAAADDVRKILAASGRASDLTRQLLALSRRQVMRPEIVDLGDVVAEIVELLRRLIGENIELETRWPDEPVLVKVDRAQLEQVIANLALNARDAMPDGGRLVIEVRRTEVGGPAAMLTVADDGVGMDAETAARAFEPFFTTKGEGGTGLGLATVHGIVKQSGGHIEVESAPSRGATFRITLPLSAGAGASAEGAAPEASAEGGGETILLVEDDPMVRQVVQTMLLDRGYRVLAAQDGNEAIAKAREDGPRIRLVISDLVMPGLNGRQTVERVRVLQPQVKVLLMSGYGHEVVAGGGPLEQDTGFVAKPFTGAELARRVRELLDRPAA